MTADLFFWEAKFDASPEYRELHARFKDSGGVYVIAADTAILYVGQTRLFKLRVSGSIARHSAHRLASGPVIANRLDWYPADEARHRTALEARLIQDLKPLRNLIRPRPAAALIVPEHYSARLR